MDDQKISMMMKHYEAMRRASKTYYDKKKQIKIENGTYRGRGRPRKVEVNVDKVI